jgi:multiple RNA-binding domain-containing protein 1
LTLAAQHLLIKWQVHLVRDKAGSSKGVVYVQFSEHEHAKDAVQELDGKSFQGRLLHILEADNKRSHRLDEFEISRLPLKKQKALKRKMEAGGATFSWNSMYMNPNAVLASVADRLGVTKADLIDPSSADAAVKQAHAETHVIQETKAFLTLNGVDLDAFKQREKDETTLFIKNFPFGTTAEELKGLFGTYGEIAKFLLPPSGTIAIIQYAQPGEGSRALKGLAYRNLKGSVLYLEIGPKNLFNKNVTHAMEGNPPRDASTKIDGDGLLDKVEPGGSSTLFVRNLNFVTTTASLTRAFEPLSGFLSAKVKTKIDPKRPQEVLSMGFGFVEFRSKQQALAALAAMNGHSLDDHQLLIQMSRKSTDAAEEQRHRDNLKKVDAHKTKIIIKNLPFEATKKDVRALLNVYGQLRSVKVPQKFNRDTRGFAFADFVTAREAENAMEALKDTHFLGRRLVLEFADEESIDPEVEIRAIESKVGRQAEMVQFSKMTGSSRKKFNVGTQDEDQ